jgi:hypothetical protein
MCAVPHHAISSAQATPSAPPSTAATHSAYLRGLQPLILRLHGALLGVGTRLGGRAARERAAQLGVCPGPLPPQVLAARPQAADLRIQCPAGRQAGNAQQGPFLE